MSNKRRTKFIREIISIANGKDVYKFLPVDRKYKFIESLELGILSNNEVNIKIKEDDQNSLTTIVVNNKYSLDYGLIVSSGFYIIEDTDDEIIIFTNSNEKYNGVILYEPSPFLEGFIRARFPKMNYNLSFIFEPDMKKELAELLNSNITVKDIHVTHNKCIKVVFSLNTINEDTEQIDFSSIADLIEDYSNIDENPIKSYYYNSDDNHDSLSDAYEEVQKELEDDILMKQRMNYKYLTNDLGFSHKYSDQIMNKIIDLSTK